jgi:hypothetical protein
MDDEADRSGLLGCAIIALLILWVGSGIWVGERLDANFARIARGMTDTQAVALLGAPKWRGRCGDGYYNFVEPMKDGVDCLVYADPFAPLIPKYPVVYVGQGHRVIGKYEYASP